MNRSVWWRFGVITTCLVGLATAACGSDPAATDGHSRTTTRSITAAPAPDPQSPEGVAVAAIREVYTWYPATEPEGSSLARARRWLGPRLLRTLDQRSEVVGTPRTSVRWSDWATARARVEAMTFAAGERPPNSTDPTVQQFKIGIEQTVVYPDGHTESLPSSAVLTTVVQTPEGWRLDAIQ